MQLVLTNEDFVLKGVSYAGFPVVLNEAMEINTYVYEFLKYQLIIRGRVSSKESWKSYGQTMYDYFAYLEAIEEDFRDVKKTDCAIVSAYRDYSIGEINLSPNTVNNRLRLIVSFYEYALKKGWINQIPFSLENVFVRKSGGFLAHTDISGGQSKSPDIMLNLY